MKTGVLLALPEKLEVALIRQLSAPGSSAEVVRRCADVPEVLAAAGAGIATLAVIRDELADRQLVAQLRDLGCRTLVVAADPAALTRSSALGAAAAEPAGSATALAETIERLTGPEGEQGAELPAEPPALVAGEDETLVAEEPGRVSGRVIAVWGPPGAPGRTSVAVNLAHALADIGESTAPVILADADTQAPSVAQTLGILADSSAIAAVSRMAGTGRLEPQSLLRACPRLGERLHVMTGLTRAARWRELPAAALDTVWEVARAAAAWTVIDIGSALDEPDEGMPSYGGKRHEATMSALEGADTVVIVGAGDPIGVRRLVAALAEAEDAGLAFGERVVVVNRVRASASGGPPKRTVHEALARFASVEDAILVPEDGPAHDRAILEGRALSEVAPDSGAWQGIELLAARLAGERRRRRRRRGLLARAQP